MKLIIAALLAVSFSAIAAEPAYWMQAYPGATKAKTDHCLRVADEAYSASLNGGMDGVAWAVLAKGTAWERCMEGK